MTSSLSVGPLFTALHQRLFPTITRWNRLEARARKPSFERALRAEIRDPLWMLTKGWLMGEFRGSDAGSPTFAKLQIAITRLTKYRPRSPACRTRAGGRSRTIARISATSTPTPPTSRSSCSWSSLVYSNDWFVIPFTLLSGAVATIDGFVVTHVFNERFWIQAAGSGADANWQRWSMFTVDVRNQPGAAADTSLVLPPTLAKIQREDVMLVRDEVANMV
jgi:hypothetical protein